MNQRRPQWMIILIVVLAVLLTALVGCAVVVSTTGSLPGTTGKPPVTNTNQTTHTTQGGAPYSLTVGLLGDGTVTMEYGTAYTDAGAEAWLQGSALPEEGQPITDIQVDNPLNTNRTGTYVITYSARCTVDGELITATTQRTVIVVDTQAPLIVLSHDPEAFTYPGHPYKEEGYAALDGHDGDLTDQVQCTEENGVVTYRVADAAGNEATVKRTIVYSDPVAPEITLLGENPMTIKVGEGYVEPGYKANDACDGDLTEKVLAAGMVSKYAAGTYTISYTVTDEAGNVAIAERTVIVKPASDGGNVVQPNGKVIYLTFDDGPSQYTTKLLDILDKYGVKATFFVVNTPYVHLVEDIVERGHAIGVHSATHDFKSIYASEDAFFADLTKMRDIIYKRTGVYTNLIRFPGGSSNTISKFNPGIMSRLTDAVEDMGYHYFDWNVDSDDAGGTRTKDGVVDNVIKGCKSRKISIVLQHDIKGYSVNAVEEIIIWGLENGYTFLPLDESSPTAHHGINN